jgi:hypothetical protein
MDAMATFICDALERDGIADTGEWQLFETIATYTVEADDFESAYKIAVDFASGDGFEPDAWNVWNEQCDEGQGWRYGQRIC